MTSTQKENIIHLRGLGKSYTEIAAAIEVSVNTVSSFCRRVNLDGQSKDIRDVGTCRYCGKHIKSKAGFKRRLFCSDACRLSWWNGHPDQVKRKAVYSFTCACCGKAFTSYGNQNRKYCSHACYIAGRYDREVPAHD